MGHIHGEIQKKVQAGTKDTSWIFLPRYQVTCLVVQVRATVTTLLISDIIGDCKN